MKHWTKKKKVDCGFNGEMKVGESEKPKSYKSGIERNWGKKKKKTENEALNQEKNLFGMFCLMSYHQNDVFSINFWKELRKRKKKKKKDGKWSVEPGRKPFRHVLSNVKPPKWCF